MPARAASEKSRGRRRWPGVECQHGAERQRGTPGPAVQQSGREREAVGRRGGRDTPPAGFQQARRAPGAPRQSNAEGEQRQRHQSLEQARTDEGLGTRQNPRQTGHRQPHRDRRPRAGRRAPPGADRVRRPRARKRSADDRRRAHAAARGRGRCRGRTRRGGRVSWLPHFCAFSWHDGREQGKLPSEGGQP